MEKCGLVKVRNQLSGRKEFVFRVQVALSRRRKSAAQCNSNSVKPPTNR